MRIVHCNETMFAIEEEREGVFALIDTDPRCPDRFRRIVTFSNRLMAIEAFELARREVRRDKATGRD